MLLATATTERISLTGKKHDGKETPPRDATLTHMACQAETMAGCRCRNWAEPNRVFCANHLDSASHQMDMPFRLLLTARANDSRWAPAFERAGAIWIQRDEDGIAKRHAAHADKYGRAFARYRRRTGDSGVEVFSWTSATGPADYGTGVPWVNAANVWDELLAAGYEVTNVILYKRDPQFDRKVSNVRFEFTQGAKPLEDFGATRNVAHEFFGEAVWGLAHPWSNPPWDLDPQQIAEVADAPERAVIDTLNLKFRNPLDQNPPSPLRYELHFANGLWAVQTVNA